MSTENEQNRIDRRGMIGQFAVLTAVGAGGVASLVSLSRSRTTETPEQDPGDSFELPISTVAVDAIKGLDPVVLAGVGKLFEWGRSQATHSAAIGQYFFPVRVANQLSLSRREWTISGTANDLKHFVTELSFLSSRSEQLSSLRSGSEFAQGAYEGGKALVADTWEMVSSPWETLKAAFSGIREGGDYLWEVVWEGRDFRKDFSLFLEALWTNKLEELAEAQGMSFALLETPEARHLLTSDARARFSGMIFFEVATLLIAFTKIAKISQATKLSRLLDRLDPDELLKNENLLPKGPRFLRNRQQRQKQAAERSQFFSKNLGSLLDPEKVSTIGEKAAKERMRKTLRWMRDADEATDVSLERMVDDALASANASRRVPDLHHDPNLLKRQMLRNYEEANALGIFDSAENLDALAHGRTAPTILRGPHAGELVDVDHIIPKAHAPDLHNNLGNLRLLPSTVNRSRRHDLDAEAVAKAEEFRRAGVWSGAIGS